MITGNSDVLPLLDDRAQASSFTITEVQCLQIGLEKKSHEACDITLGVLSFKPIVFIGIDLQLTFVSLEQ